MSDAAPSFVKSAADRPDPSCRVRRIRRVRAVHQARGSSTIGARQLLVENRSGSPLLVVKSAAGKLDSQRSSAASRSGISRASATPNRLDLHRLVTSPVDTAIPARFAAARRVPLLGCGEVLAW
ncbi:hypothetical protein ACIA8C_30175 [Nocardia sp. NPDC051321]|uniref:hypothetical protein n=1 Tax=Nocardia sp. NPDC051321 TaxID=3364323 RepID=UPI00379DC0FE